MDGNLTIPNTKIKRTLYRKGYDHKNLFEKKGRTEGKMRREKRKEEVKEEKKKKNKSIPP